MKPNLNKSERVERNQSISNGIRSECPKAMIPVNGELMKALDIAKACDQATAAEKKVTHARAAYLAAVEEAHTADAKVKAMIQPVKSFVVNSFGARSSIAASFGFVPRKISKVTVEVRAEAVEKLRATRIARNTMGSRQKAAVHGQTSTPAPSPVSPSTVQPATPAVAQPAPQPPAPAATNGTTDATQSALVSANGASH